MCVLTYSNPTASHKSLTTKSRKLLPMVRTLRAMLRISLLALPALLEMLYTPLWNGQIQIFRQRCGVNSSDRGFTTNCNSWPRNNSFEWCWYHLGRWNLVKASEPRWRRLSKDLALSSTKPQPSVSVDFEWLLPKSSQSMVDFLAEDQSTYLFGAAFPSHHHTMYSEKATTSHAPCALRF